MKTQGLRIFDSKDNVLSVSLSEILEEIPVDSALNWCLLFLDGMPMNSASKLANEYIGKINASANGLLVNWNELCLISSKFHQVYETLILGCKEKKSLHKYDNDQDMYESCDLIIELVDCAFWQIFSKDLALIDRLKNRFKEIELIDSSLGRYI